MGRVEWIVPSQLSKEERHSRKIFYRLLRRHQHEAVAVYSESRHTTLKNDVEIFIKGTELKPVSPKNCVGQEPVSPEKCQR